MLKKILTWRRLPFWFWHIPTVPYYLYLSLKSRDLLFFGATNPCMRDAGYIRMPKSKFLENIDPLYLPQQFVITPGKSGVSDVEEIMAEHHLSYPVVAKPNYGERGWAVRKIDNREQLKRYLQQFPKEIMIQEYLSDPIELGVLWYRFPGEEKGHISSLTSKDLYQITGDGVSTLEALALKDKNRAHHFRRVRHKYLSRLSEVIPEGETLTLDIVAHLSHGAGFRDCRHLINDDMIAFFTQLCAPIEGFFYGRIDLKVPSIEHFKRFEGIKLIEINGTGSMPSHMFDPKLNTWQAYKALFHHWKTIHAIARVNTKRGVAQMKLRHALAGLRKRMDKEEPA